MTHTEATTGQIQKLLTIVILAMAQARAEESANESKRILVSIPDRKLALVEGERVVKVYDVAVGKPTTPSPEGDFTIENPSNNPTGYGPKKAV